MMDLLSRISSLLNTLSSTWIMPVISVFYTGWLDLTIENLVIIGLISVTLIASPLLCFRFAFDDTLDSKIDSVENVNNQFLPVYLGYIFVTFSISDIYWFVFIYLFIIALLASSRLIYFNPLFLCFGYSFYKVHTINGISCYVLSNRIIMEDKVHFTNLKRLNNMTFLEWTK